MAQLRSGKKQKIDEEPTYRVISILHSKLMNAFSYFRVHYRTKIHSK